MKQVRDQGFTLLEIVLALTVLGMVMAMLALSLGSTLRVVESTEQQEAVYHQAQTALRRIGGDLTAAAVEPALPFSGKRFDLDGQRADSLAFASWAHLVFNPDKQLPGLAYIEYQLKPDDHDHRRLKLLRADTLVRPGLDAVGQEEARERGLLLADNLRSVHFVYVHQGGQEFDNWGQEQETHPAEEGEQKPRPLPAVVRCTLEFWLDPDRDTVQTFTTNMVVPAGLYAREAEHAD